MTLRFYNTLTRKKEAFNPLKGKEVRLYTCGPTVYDYAHIGNFRTYVWEDILRRWLKYRGYKVRQVMNLTDVDDKTIKRANEENVALDEVTGRYKKAFFEDMDKMNIEKAEVYPAATEHIKEMVVLIEKLLKKKYAYKGEDGTIYYDISKFKDYGKLSNFKLKKLKAGARVKQDEYEKQKASDFALWKKWDENDGKVFWETKLGKGRPGWHIECSAMSMKYLGESFDIHTGGIDNMFPHHENEIAQSEAATGKKFVNFWMHAKHLIVDGRKMSKSFGNFYTLRDLDEFEPMAIRYELLSAHYMQELNFTIKGIENSAKAVERLNEFIERLKEAGEGRDNEKSGAGKAGEGRRKWEAGAKEADEKGNAEAKKIIAETKKKFEEAMDDNLNVPVALSAVFDFVRDINGMIDKGQIGEKNSKEIIDFMKAVDSVLGVMRFEKKKVKVDDEVKALIEERERLRKEGKYDEADRIRAELRERGVVIDDTGSGTKVRKA